MNLLPDLSFVINGHYLLSQQTIKKWVFIYFNSFDHGLRTPSEEIAFTARPKIKSQSQIHRYGRSIFCLPHRPKISGFFVLCLHWVSKVRAFDYMVGEIKEQQRTREEASKFITILKIGALGIYQGSNMQFGNSPRCSKALRYTTIICTELEDAQFELASHICRCTRNLINKTLSKIMKKLVKLQHVFHY